MLWNASGLNGFSIKASDGTLGGVTDLLFEDISWVIRWLVVDTGNWLADRKVLLPISVLGPPSQARHDVPVKLTMQQVKDSPVIDMDQPVSRQMEFNVYDYYGFDPYWGRGVLSTTNCDVAPSLMSLRPSANKPQNAICSEAQVVSGDSHLRSMISVTGYHIHAIDGDIGHADGFLVEDTSWSVRYIKIDTKNWWPGEKVLISPRSIRAIEATDRLIQLDVSRQKVKDAPRYHPAVTVDGAYEELFRKYYFGSWGTF